ncbi:MAG: succinylglutamate desuccinylase/aspartoacylase family protein [Candidatus Pacebacteria bacterium]|nr:succinylglutamate desuccinylase/aspartoacylase family protein [Candidatus Paceibacterota bacterium]
MKIEKFGFGDIVLNIIVGVHGDENAPVKGFFLLKEYLKHKKIKKAFQVIVANEGALENNKRFIEKDLNRCFPGNASGCHEERLANNILEEVLKVDINFDFHSTTIQIEKPYGIVSVYNEKSRKIMMMTGVKEYIFDSSESLIKFAPNSLAYEVGWEIDPKSSNNAFSIMKNILINFDIIDEELDYKPYNPEIYLIYHFILKSKFSSISNDLQDFKYVEKDEVIGWTKSGEIFLASEGFYPVFTKDDFMIKKCKKITIEE